MNRHEFESLSPSALDTACFDPLIRAFKLLRTEEGDEAGFFEELTPGQRSLFIFRVYYDHASKSAAELYWWSAYFMAQPGRWPALKDSLRFLGEEQGLTLLQDMEQVLTARGCPRSPDDFQISSGDMDQDSELSAAFHALDHRLQTVSPSILQRIYRCIQQHPQQFVEFSS